VIKGGERFSVADLTFEQRDEAVMPRGIINNTEAALLKSWKNKESGGRGLAWEKVGEEKDVCDGSWKWWLIHETPISIAHLGQFNFVSGRQ
jgi:hypothetical protein